MALSNALFFVSVFVCPLLLRQCYGQGDVPENSTLDANSPTATTLSPELSTDFSHSSKDTEDNSTTAANNTTFATDGSTTEGPLSFNATTTDHITDAFVSSSSASANYSTSEPLQPSGSGWTQRFDLASFFGGIILAVGLIGLVFLVYKVCQLKRSGYSNLA